MTGNTLKKEDMIEDIKEMKEHNNISRTKMM